MTQSIKALAAADALSFIPGPTRWKERANSYRLSDLTHESWHIFAHEQNIQQISVILKVSNKVRILLILKRSNSSQGDSFVNFS